jgi:hypothetical protein
MASPLHIAFVMTNLAAIAITDLTTVTGGQSAGSFESYTTKQREQVANPYRQVVCTTAGIKGAPDLAKGVYGAGATDSDKVRAAEMLKSYCQAGAALPAQAPKSPF